MNKINYKEDNKIQILLAELSERYASSHHIRERNTKVILWICGMALGLSWLILDKREVFIYQKISITIIVFLLFSMIFLFLKSQKKGFENNRKAMLTIEKALGMYETGVFIKNKSLLPKEYTETKQKWSDQSIIWQIWIIITVFVLLVSIWSIPTLKDKNESNKKIEFKIKKGEKS